MGSSKIMKLRERLMEELENYGKEGPLDVPKLEAIYKLSESIKAIDTICAMDENDYSSSRARRGNSNMYPYSYNDRSMSYHDSKQHRIEELNRMMNEEKDEYTRSILRNALSQLERY